MNEDAVEIPTDMLGLPVHDVNGAYLGRVARVDAEAIGVTLSSRAERRFGSRDVTIPRGLIVDVDDHDVTLREEARFVVHPEARPTDSTDE